MAAPRHSDVTRLLARAGTGDAAAADELLPLVYDHLRDLAERNMRREPPGHTLQPTALVHEAYLRLIGEQDMGWNSRGHFYAAAAEAMRRILVERARRYRREKHGGKRRRVPLDGHEPAVGDPSVDLPALDEALHAMQAEHPRPAEVVMLRYFAGLTEEQVAEVLGVSRRTVQGDWKFARVWLLDRLREDDAEPEGADG